MERPVRLPAKEKLAGYHGFRDGTSETQPMFDAKLMRAWHYRTTVMNYSLEQVPQRSERAID